LNRIKATDVCQLCAGVRDYWTQPELGNSWGGPFNGQSGRQGLFQQLIHVAEPTLILETGTYRGATTEFFAKSNLPVITIEAHPRNYAFSRIRLRRHPNVKVWFEDSRIKLRSILGSITPCSTAKPILAYLDAHWNADLPLAEEIEIIFSNCPNAVVMIDDFQVPDDPGYAYDDYGQGKALTSEYIAPEVQKFDLALFYPTVSSADETGARRGCVVLANKKLWACPLAGTDLMRTIPAAEECAAQS
jgi:hypothetical protein